MSGISYDIEYLRSICTDEKIMISAHARRRCVERGITINDIKAAVASGEIIEVYPDDKPFPSCLICGKSAKRIYVHVVLSTNERLINIITAYYPDTDKWENDFKTRKSGDLK